MTKLDGILNTISAGGKEAILCGDLNCCFMSGKRDVLECKQLKSLFNALNYKQLISSPTRITKDSKSLIDLIATNCPQNISDSGVASTHLSDHELVYCVRKLNWKKAPAQLKTLRNYAKYDPTSFCKDFEGVEWKSSSIPEGQSISVDELWVHFKTSFVTVADRHAPIIQKRVRGVYNLLTMVEQKHLNQHAPARLFSKES